MNAPDNSSSPWKTVLLIVAVLMVLSCAGMCVLGIAGFGLFSLRRTQEFERLKVEHEVERSPRLEESQPPRPTDAPVITPDDEPPYVHRTDVGPHRIEIPPLPLTPDLTPSPAAPSPTTAPPPHDAQP